MNQRFRTRLLDILISATVLSICSPIIVIAAALTALTIGFPIIFKQKRVGRNNVIFTIYKFRTMINSARVKSSITIGKDPRISRFGLFIRKYKIDELPQFINVLKGEMSIVGPRPELPEYSKYYTQEYKEFFSVDPGITDYASIKYRNEADLLALQKDPEKYYINEIIPKKIKASLVYIKNQTLANYLKIISRTIMVIFVSGSKRGRKKT